METDHLLLDYYILFLLKGVLYKGFSEWRVFTAHAHNQARLSLFGSGAEQSSKSV